MNIKTILILAVTALIAWILVLQIKPSSSPDQIKVKAVIPELSSRIDQLQSVHIINRDESLSIIQSDKGWALEEKGRYPINTQTLKALMNWLKQAQYTEQKTADAKQFARLNLLDPKLDSTSNAGIQLALQFSDESFSFIVGKEAQQGGLFFRSTDSEQSWRVTPHFNISMDPEQWLSLSLNPVAARFWQSIEVQGEEGFTLARATPEDSLFTLSPMPTDYTYKDEHIINSMAELLENLNFSDVTPAMDAMPAQSKLTYTSWSNQKLILSLYQHENQNWLQITAKNGDTSLESGIPEAMFLEIMKQHNGWWYRIPDHLWKQLARQKMDFLKPLESDKTLENT